MTLFKLLNYIVKRGRQNDTSTNDVDKNEMRRYLGVIKLTILGIGSTIGAGIYVILGLATKTIAGPSIVLSFLVAGLSTLLSALCFAQYALRVQNGGLYQYVSRTHGQYLAFLTAWTALIGAALMAAVSGQGISNCVDSVFNETISNFTKTYIAQWPSTVIFTDHPNVLATCFVIAATILVSRIKIDNFSAIINFLAALNTSVLFVFIAIGLVYGDVDNWGSSTDGFFAFGFSGVLRGAAFGFTAYGGFEFICMATNEAKEPEKTVPRALVACVASTTIINTGTAAAFTLLVPYWLIDDESPLVSAIEQINLHAVSFALLVGPIIGMICSMALGIYAVSRLLYSLASEGLIDKRLAELSPDTKSPVVATITTGVFVSFVCFIFKIDNLASLVTSGVLMIMTLISFGTLYLLYRETDSLETTNILETMDIYKEHNTVTKHRSGSVALNLDFQKEFGSEKSGGIYFFATVNLHVYVLLILACSVGVASILTFFYDNLRELEWFTTTSAISALITISLSTLAIASCSKMDDKRDFKLPLGPVIPVISGFFNVLFFVGGLDITGAVLFVIMIGSGTVMWLAVCVMDFTKQKRGTSYEDLPNMDDGVVSPGQKLLTSSVKGATLEMSSNTNETDDRFSTFEFIDLDSNHV